MFPVIEIDVCDKSGLKEQGRQKTIPWDVKQCQKYSLAINAKGKPFPAKSLIMALLLEQHKMIK